MQLSRYLIQTLADIGLIKIVFFRNHETQLRVITAYKHYGKYNRLFAYSIPFRYIRFMDVLSLYRIYVLLSMVFRGAGKKTHVEFHAVKCKPKSETFICFQATLSFRTYIYTILIHNIHVINEYSTRVFFLSLRRSRPQLVEGLTRAREYICEYIMYIKRV